MAIMYPECPVDFNGSCGERDVFESLRSLDDSCVVFHSLLWLNAIGPRRFETALPLQGEADIVVIDPRRGILIIEVKSGGIRYGGRQWYQTNTATQEEKPIQDPVRQADRSAHFLRKRISSAVPGGKGIGVFHAVWFPSIHFTPSTAQLDCDPAIVLDLATLAAPAAAIRSVFNFWQAHHPSKPIAAHQLNAIQDLLAPEFRAMPAFRASMESRERQFVRMTLEQARVFDYLEDQRHALIGGPAGCGKTLLAVELARRIADSGERVAFLCYNSLLREHLKSVHGCHRVSFDTFHSYAGAFLQERDLTYTEHYCPAISRIDSVA